MKRPRLAGSILAVLLLLPCVSRAGTPVRAGSATGDAPVDRARKPARKAVVTLRDGTRLVGRISSLKNGLISVETEQLGTMTVPTAAVESIVFSPPNLTGRRRAVDSGATRTRGAGRGLRSNRPAVRPTAPSLHVKAAGMDIQGLMQAITGDPDIMRSITALQEDPDIQAVLRDPEIQRAVQSGNLLQLMKDPKIIKLLGNKKIQDVSRRIVKGRKR
ncbi:MAG: hypothetical protein GXP31_03935 [Kiritimatiellaeota bacterium]|nr:hypothetical protein [Kiritimatiellota bacterium]